MSEKSSLSQVRDAPACYFVAPMPPRPASRIRLGQAVLLALALPGAALAQHFSRAYIDVRLVPPDSVRVTVEADGQDFQNAVRFFPYFDEPAGSGMESFRRYERMVESYLLQRLKLRADARPVNLSVVSWRHGGEGRDDGFDTLTISGNHAITLGGRLPADAQTLSAWAEIWIERPEVAPDRPTIVEYNFFEGETPLRRLWSRTERWVRFPLGADSLAVLRRNPIAPPEPRSPVDHSGHGH